MCREQNTFLFIFWGRLSLGSLTVRDACWLHEGGPRGKIVRRRQPLPRDPLAFESRREMSLPWTHPPHDRKRQTSTEPRTPRPRSIHMQVIRTNMYIFGWLGMGAARL